MNPAPSPEAFLDECRELQAALRPHPTLATLRRSPGWPELAARLDAVLGGVRRFAPAGPAADAAPGPEPALRAVHWNIEKAKRYPQVEAALLGHPQLRGADLVLLNEVDLGMARSDHRDVAVELGRALGLHAVWAPMFLETTPGRDEDADFAAGRANREGLMGLAILSRWPVGTARIVELPSAQRVQFDLERMYGRHVALVAEVLRPGAPFVAVTTHLDVHRTRAHRADQVRVLTAALRGEARPVLLAGDLNTLTMDRGRPLDAARAGLALLLTPGPSLARRLLYPDRGPWREPLFEELRAAGFEWEGVTDRGPTLRLRLDRVRETRTFAATLAPAMRRLSARVQRRALLRLDWFAGRGWSGARGGTVPGLDGPDAASDHAPITAEFLPP